MPVLQPEEIKFYDIDTLAIRIFLKALEIIGGPRKLIEHRNLTWITSLMEAAYVIVLSQESLKTEDEIAQFLGLTRQTVRNILRADPDLVLQKLEGELQEKTPRAHTAGGLAKLAYKEIKEGRDNLSIFIYAFQNLSESLGIYWPIDVLKSIKGMDFPAEKEELAERLGNLRIKDVPASEILEKIEYPIKSPSDLLHKIREALEKEESK